MARRKPRAAARAKDKAPQTPAEAEFERQRFLGGLLDRLRTGADLDPEDRRALCVAVEYLLDEPGRSRTVAALRVRLDPLRQAYREGRNAELARALGLPGKQAQRYDATADARVAAEYERLLRTPKGQPMPEAVNFAELFREAERMLASAPVDAPPGPFSGGRALPMTPERPELRRAPVTLRALARVKDRFGFPSARACLDGSRQSPTAALPPGDPP